MSETPLQLPGYAHVYSGKVRDLYAPVGTDGQPREDQLLLVASDRISAYDFVLDTTIPDKGEILTRMSLWWFDQLGDLVPHHVVSTEVPASVKGRAVVCEELAMYPVECVARGYLTGSGKKEYDATGRVCGVKLPEGLTEASKLDEPIFTPATKAEQGDHDENVTFDFVANKVGSELAGRLRDATLEVYTRAAEYAETKGIILADTKFEFGLDEDGELVLADEVLTPDSSRYWPADGYEEGKNQPSFDKQYVRIWLKSPKSGWDPSDGSLPPELPGSVVEATRDRYIEAYERLSGARFSEWPGEHA